MLTTIHSRAYPSSSGLSDQIEVSARGERFEDGTPYVRLGVSDFPLNFTVLLNPAGARELAGELLAGASRFEEAAKC